MYAFWAPHLHHRDVPALDVLAIILGQGESSRLVRQLRDEQRLVNTISAFNLSMNWGEGFFSVDAEIASRDGVTDEQASADVKAAVREGLLFSKEEQDALAFEGSCDWCGTNWESQERPYREDILQTQILKLL